MKSFTKYCLKEQWIPHDFMGGVPAPKSDRKLPVYMSLKELKQLFESLENQEHPLAFRNEVLFKLLATSGMRRQEIVDLKWHQLDLEAGTLRVYGKGRKERLLPIHALVLPLLVRYKDELPAHAVHEDEPVFFNRWGQAIDPRGLHRIFKWELQKAGLPPHRFSLHHLRHTFATLLLQNPDEKINLKTLQDLLGHESLSTTGMYTHVDMESKQKAIQSLKI